MSASLGAEVVVVGSGFGGILVARELLKAEREVLLIERGGFFPHSQQVLEETTQLDIPSAEPNDEAAPGSPSYPWSYLYGVGGTSLHWTGVTPRFLPSDFQLRSRYGVGRDWPLTYEELAPFYEQAERLLGVAGGRNRFFPGTAGPPQPPHPDSGADRVVGPHLQPYFPLPQARPTRAIGGRPPCCGSGRCELCPVDARYSILHTLDDERLLDHPGITLRDRTVVGQLRLRAGRVAALECFDSDGEPLTIEAKTVVLAANGLENPGILLRSGLEGEDVGRYLFDHSHRLVEIELSRRYGAGEGASLETGVSYAFADGPFRSDRGSVLVYPHNLGMSIRDSLIEAVSAGRSGEGLRGELRERFERTLILDVLGEDLPRRDRYVELSPNKDVFGLPLNRINYPPDSAYLDRSRAVVYDQLEKRLAPLGARVIRADPAGEGAHLLGTCYMSDRGGVVDRDQRHHEVANLYVTGGSAFPSYSAHHPTLTIAALAIRLGRHLAIEAG
jgi:choline dehydrogenase-like flavoprotein